MESLNYQVKDRQTNIPKMKADQFSIDALLEFYFIDTVHLWRNKLDELAKEYELSRLERRILVYIGRYSGIRQADLALIMDVEPQSLTRALESMESKKWLQKFDDFKDKRAKSLHLTAAGLEKLEKASSVSERIRPLILNGLSETDKEILKKTLINIRENLGIKV